MQQLLCLSSLSSAIVDHGCLSHACRQMVGWPAQLTPFAAASHGMLAECLIYTVTNNGQQQAQAMFLHPLHGMCNT